MVSGMAPILALRTDGPGQGASHGLSRSHLAQRFRDIEHDLGTTIHAFDFHKVVNYLRNPTTIEALKPHLQ